jgi:hypothetical protein
MKKPNIKPYTHAQLAFMYDISWKTLQRWLKPYEKEIGPKEGKIYNSLQVEIIFRRVGRPRARLK